MGRRRWKLVTITAFLLCVIKETQCQDENDYYYTPVERNFAQVQPPLYPNNRPSSTFFGQDDTFRPQPVQQAIHNEDHVRFPSPNYNQHPSPFQLPTGRSPSGSLFYVNQPEFNPSQRQRFRPALPYNFQTVHPASTKRPDVSQIHSVAYQNDPSKPETFLGQITINNPDIDFLRNSKFKNIPFDSNSLKSNGQSGHILHDEDIDNDNQDLFDHHRVTTYNPSRLINRQRPSPKPKLSQFPNYDSSVNDKVNFKSVENKVFEKSNYKIQKTDPGLYRSSSTEYKALLELEPLLEDDISDISSFRELMKNKQASFDVEVIKSNQTNNSDLEPANDNKPDASSMNTDNISKTPEIAASYVTMSTSSTTSPTTMTTTVKSEENHNDHDENISHEVEDGEEYEYYDEAEEAPVKHTTQLPHIESATDFYDEYDSTEELEKVIDEPKPNKTESFEVLVMKPGNTMVKDDNFKHFVDSTEIDQSDRGSLKTTPKVVTDSELTSEEVSSVEVPSILGQEVVSVVTTKSVVNGTISIPDVTFTPSTPKIYIDTEKAPSLETTDDEDKLGHVTTENVIVVASVQTSRSVSGARFLPFAPVEQEDNKQILNDEKDTDNDETVTKDPGSEISIVNSSSSTENINDKLDSIQSELSSAVLSGTLDKQNKNIELITESTTEQTTSTTSISTTSTTTSTTTTALPNVFTLKSTQPTTSTERSSPDPLPVLIKKFTPRVTTSTTPKPRKKLVTVMDDLAGLLPLGYRPRTSFKDKRTSTTTTTTTTTTSTNAPTISFEEPNGTQGRSSGINTKNRVIVLDVKSLLPKEYKPKDKSQDDHTKKFQSDDISKLLPPGYKPIPELPDEKETSKPLDILNKAQKIDILAFLPKGFNLNDSTTTTTTTEGSKLVAKLPANAVPVDITALLPPGFKLNTTGTENEELPIPNIKVVDVSSLLPPGFKLNATEEPVVPLTTTKSPGGIKLVFPSRPGSKTTRKTTPKPSGGLGPSQVTPKIQKGWPTRASTEFTGWPSPSTTPFSIEKLLEAQRNATATSPISEFSTEPTTRRMTKTTTTTPAPPPSTTPGVCRRECDIAATIKIVGGVQWIPELLDRHTEEWQKLANEVKDELNSVYSHSDSLKKWYKNIRIDGFSPGSVLVDYFIELNDVNERVDTIDLKKMFHRSLHEAKPGSVVETVTEEATDSFDPDMMMGDQPEEDRMKKSNEKMTKTIDKSAGKLEIGKFVMDPAYTEFIVLPKRGEQKPIEPEEESFLPQWGIAVIVIALASLLFVVIFGVTVLVNRQKSAKAKAPIPLSEDMLRELDKSHMGGFDDMHQLKERELPYLPSGKRMSTAFIEQLAYPNPGDSWRSEWTPQMQKYMQHYTPDSGRGSQIYGAAGNGYGYGGGSQLYGQTGGGGSQVYGYTGEYPRSHYGRRRSDYDSNF